MTALSLSTGLTLTAAAADSPAPRTAEGILVPYDEPGRTSLGLKTIKRGALRFTADAVTPDRPKLVGTYGHNNEAAVSRLVAHEDRPGGLWGRLRIAETPAGDLLLAEIRDGVRDGLSVELSDLTFDPADPDTVVSARVDFVAHVPVGAYDSARVHALAATVTPTGEPVTEPTPPAAPEGLDALVASAVAAAMAPTLAQLQAAAYAAPASGAPSAATLVGVGNAPALTAPAADVDPLAEAARLSAAYHQTKDQTLLAALQDITATGLPLFQESSSRLGEKLWEGTADTTRPFVDLMSQGDLTSMTYYGWEWTQFPEMYPWDGDKTAIQGNPVALRQVPFEAQRCAAGWDVDRKYKDFGDALFWQEFYTEQVRAYRRLSNAWAAEAILANAVDVSNPANLAGYPTGFAGLVPTTGVAEGANQLLRAAAIGRMILENTPRVGQGPDYILIHPLDFLRITDVAAIDLPAFLSLLGVNPASFRQHVNVPRNTIVMGVKQSMKFRELPGSGGKGTPIRVEALDVARGGVDSAVYGYVGISRERVGGIISVKLDDNDGQTG